MMIACRDCIFWRETEEQTGLCMHPLQPKDVTTADDGCGHGKLKEES